MIRAIRFATQLNFKITQLIFSYKKIAKDYQLYRKKESLQLNKIILSKTFFILNAFETNLLHQFFQDFVQLKELRLLENTSIKIILTIP